MQSSVAGDRTRAGINRASPGACVHLDQGRRRPDLEASLAVPPLPSCRSSPPAPAEGAADELLPGLAEVDVDDAVKDKVKREVRRLENVGGDDCRVEQLHRFPAHRVVVEL